MTKYTPVISGEQRKDYMTISLSIMGSLSRLKNIKKIQNDLGAGVPYSLDDTGNLWENCKSAWRMYSPAADFHLVLQDDAVLCPNFIKELTTVLEPGKVYSLYFGWRKNYASMVKKEYDKGSKMITLDRLHWGLAVVLPTNLIDEMIMFGDKQQMPKHYDDTRIKTFLRLKGIPINYTLPSLVDHKHDEVSTITKTLNGARKAFYFKGAR